MKSLSVNLTGKVTGGLSFNQEKRMSKTKKIKELAGGNTTLGPVHRRSGILKNQFYKYEVVIVFDGLEEAFYGQMITKPVINKPKDLKVVFEDDYPANDWDGLDWGGLKGKEKKGDFPVFEVKGNTVRWIDAPQRKDFSLSKKRFVFIYAGACGRATYLKIIEIIYPNKAAPTAKLISKDQFKKAVSSWSYK